MLSICAVCFSIVSKTQSVDVKISVGEMKHLGL